MSGREEEDIDIFGRIPSAKRTRINRSADNSAADEKNIEDEEWYETLQEEEEENDDAIILDKALRDLKSVLIDKNGGKTEQLTATMALLNLHEVQHRMSRRLYKVQLEKRKMANLILDLKMKLDRQHQELTLQRESQPDPRNLPKTYSQAASNLYGGPTANPTRDEPWTTPKSKPRHEIVITSIDEESRPKTKEKWEVIKKTIAAKDIDGGLRNARQTNSGAIVLEAHDTNQRDKLVQILRNHADIKIKDPISTNPLFIITGMEKGYSEEAFINILVQQNSDIAAKFDIETLKKDLKLITKKTCRNDCKENWILQAPADTFKFFVKKETIVFDLMRLYVREYVSLTVCYRCSSFNHIAKYCKATPCCHKCGEEHESKDCKKLLLDCPNCKKSKIEERRHSARDPNCPCFKKKWENVRTQQVNYGL